MPSLSFDSKHVAGYVADIRSIQMNPVSNVPQGYGRNEQNHQHYSRANINKMDG